MTVVQYAVVDRVNSGHLTVGAYVGRVGEIVGWGVSEEAMPIRMKFEDGAVVAFRESEVTLLTRKLYPF